MKLAKQDKPPLTEETQAPEGSTEWRFFFYLNRRRRRRYKE
jgi:hypothetical protein